MPLFVCLFVCLSVCVYVSLFVCLFVHNKHPIPLTILQYPVCLLNCKPPPPKKKLHLITKYRYIYYFYDYFLYFGYLFALVIICLFVCLFVCTCYSIPQTLDLTYFFDYFLRRVFHSPFLLLLCFLSSNTLSPFLLSFITKQRASSQISKSISIPKCFKERLLSLNKMASQRNHL